MRESAVAEALRAALAVHRLLPTQVTICAVLTEELYTMVKSAVESKASFTGLQADSAGECGRGSPPGSACRPLPAARRR